MRKHRHPAVLDAVNALQQATLLTDNIRRTRGIDVDDLEKLATALHRAIDALRRRSSRATGELTHDHMDLLFQQALEEHGDMDGLRTFDALKLAFMSMRATLTAAGANADDMRAFVVTIDREITSASDIAAALRPDVSKLLYSVFQGWPVQLPTGTVTCDFLNRVRFADADDVPALQPFLQ